MSTTLLGHIKMRMTTMHESNVDGGRFDGRDYKVSVTIVF